MSGEVRSRRGAGGSCLLAIALVGFMGAGKTTVGRALAERLGWRFADLDDLIQAREGRSVEQIFREQGEAGFRELERMSGARSPATREESRPLVLALGGGAFPEEAVQEVLTRGRDSGGISGCAGRGAVPALGAARGGPAAAPRPRAVSSALRAAQAGLPEGPFAHRNRAARKSLRSWKRLSRD